MQREVHGENNRESMNSKFHLQLADIQLVFIVCNMLHAILHGWKIK